MTRSKPQSIVSTIKDNKQCDAVLRELADIDRDIKAQEADMNLAIATIKTDCEMSCAVHLKRKQSLEASLQAYADYNKDELFNGKRSIELLFGFIGYRKSSVLKPAPKNTWATIMGRLKELGFTDAIRTKQTVDKDVLATWSDEKLQEIHARRIEKDTFWYEAKAEEIEEA